MNLFLLTMGITVPRYNEKCNITHPFKLLNDNCTDNCNSTSGIITLDTNFACIQTTTCNNKTDILLASGQILSFCIDSCTGNTQFFDKTIMQCVSQCNQPEQFVDSRNICLQQCDQSVSNTTGKIINYSWSYQVCQNCQNNSPFYNNGNCVENCPSSEGEQYGKAQYETGRCLSGACNGYLSNNTTGQASTTKYCFSCPLNEPFYNQAANQCTAVCPEAVNDQGICEQCPSNMFLNPVIDKKSGLQTYKCQQSCDTNISINRVCQSCWNISRARSLFDPETKMCASQCSSKYNYNGEQINLVDQNMVCTTQNQNYINEINTYGISKVYQTNMLLYSFKESYSSGGWPTIDPCPNFKYNGRCVNECPNKLNGTINVVDINKQCVTISNTSKGYLQNVSGQTYQIFHPVCDQYLSIQNDVVQCRETCDNYVLDSLSAKLCLDNHTCNQKFVITQEGQYLPSISCQQSCTEGFVEIISNICVKEASCYQYFQNRCNNTDNPGCQNKYQQNGSIQCITTCTPIYALNYICVNSCKNQNPPLVVAYDQMTCLEQCQRSDIVELKGQETFCKLCDTQLKDIVNNVEQCVTTCPAIRPYNNFGICDTSCTNSSLPYLLLYGTNNCTTNCQDYYLHGTFNNLNVTYCINNCSNSDSKYIKSETNKTCVSACDKQEIVVRENTCYLCNGQEPYKLDNNTCVSSCAARNFLVEDAICVQSCSSGKKQTKSAGEIVCVTVNRSIVAPLTGGIIGGICLIVLIALIVLGVLGKLMCCRKQNKLQDAKKGFDEEQPPPQVNIIESNLIKSSALQGSQMENKSAIKSRHLTPLPETNHSTTQIATEAENPPEQEQKPIIRRRRRARKIKTDDFYTESNDLPMSPQIGV